MSAPKHLWSGDWQDEPVPSPPARSEVPVADPEPAAPPRKRWNRRWSTGAALAGVLAVVVVAAAVWAITSGSTHVHRTARHSAGHHAAVTASAPADALGLELASVRGRVVVVGVLPGSPMTAVGVSAGQQLLAINGQAVHSPAQANAIIHSFALGTAVTMQLVQGAAQITAQIQEPGIP